MNLKILILTFASLPLIFVSPVCAQEKKPQTANMNAVNTQPDQMRVDEFKNLLFADQTLEELTSCFKLEKVPAEEDIPHYFALALDNTRKSKWEEAKKNLKYVLNIPKTETRWRLWAWKALRQLGENPAPKEGSEVRGVVIEFPIQSGYDTLAVYSDGSLCYINYTGKIAIWDVSEDSRFDSQIKNILESANSFLSRKTSVLEKHKAVKTGFVQISILTFGGIYQVEARKDEIDEKHPFDTFIESGGRILLGLTELVNQNPQQK
jgi:hypothetical protein